MRTPRVRLRGVPVPEAEWELARQDPLGEAAIGEDFILCLECGRRFSKLDGKHFGIHGMTSDEYREAWGYPASQALSSRAVVEVHRRRSSARRAEIYRRGADTPMYRSEVTFERVCEVLVRTGSVRETCLELKCTGRVVQDRLRSAGTNTAEVLRNVEPPPPPSLSPKGEMPLRRLLRAVAARFAGPDRYEGALRVLLADDSSHRRMQIVRGSGGGRPARGGT